MILSKEISNLIGTLGRIKSSIDILSKTVFNNRHKVIQDLNMAVFYINKAIEELREE
ncbi:MAG: hypothetical protein J6Y02_11720 [Pseudobutyrivibrio sp.]|nr:hypothetical protein [Pseudobutyrivibrio sp.]